MPDVLTESVSVVVKSDIMDQILMGPIKLRDLVHDVIRVSVVLVMLPNCLLSDGFVPEGRWRWSLLFFYPLKSKKSNAWRFIVYSIEIAAVYCAFQVGIEIETLIDCQIEDDPSTSFLFWTRRAFQWDYIMDGSHAALLGEATFDHASRRPFVWTQGLFPRTGCSWAGWAQEQVAIYNLFSFGNSDGGKKSSSIVYLNLIIKTFQKKLEKEDSYNA